MDFADKKSYNARTSEYYKKRYIDRKNFYIARLGGVCVSCGSSDSLEFDHIDPSTKSYTFTDKIAGGNPEKLELELIKLQLLCTTCHKEKTSVNGEDGSVPHGGGATGVRNCYCELCAPIKAAYMKERQEKYNENRRKRREAARIKKNED